MSGRDIKIPFGPDKTGGLGIDPIAPEDEGRDPLPGPPAEPAAASADAGAEEPVPASAGGPSGGAAEAAVVPFPEEARAESGAETDYHPGGLSDAEAEEQGVDEFQMSVLALKDSIGQGRELKEREKERKELAEALRADHVELSDRENILANYQELVVEQDAIIDQGTRQREADKAEAAQVAGEMEQVQGRLAQMREEYAEQMQPLEAELGRVRAAADQAKNDERSRKSELGAAESELRRAGDSAANVAASRHEQVEAAYADARARSEQAKDQLAQVEKVYEEAQQQIEQNTGPLERRLEDLNRRAESLKRSVNQLGDDISAARKRRQYCDSVYRYPDETARMRAEVEAAEALARRMDVENEALRKRLEASKKQAFKAKVAIGIVIAIVIAFIITLIVVSGR